MHAASVVLAIHHFNASGQILSALADLCLLVPQLKGIDGRAPQGVGSVSLFDTTRAKFTRSRHSKYGQIDSSSLIGAWPLFVGGVIGLVNSVNERDLSLLVSAKFDFNVMWFHKTSNITNMITLTLACPGNNLNTITLTLACPRNN